MKIVKTKTSDGFQFDGLLTEAENSKKIIIHIHGMAGSILLEEYYTNMHEYYPANGYSFLAGEHRGTGMVTDFVKNDSDSIRGNAFEIFEECIVDIQSWIEFAKSKGYEEIWLQGHSLGTSKVSYYISQTKNHGVKGLILLSPSDMIGLVHDPEGQRDHNILLPEAKDAIYNFGDEKLGWEVVNKINIPVIAFSGTEDDGIVPVMDAHDAMKKLVSELKSSPRVKTVVFDGAEHSFNGFGEKIVEEIIEFVNQ